MKNWIMVLLVAFGTFQMTAQEKAKVIIGKVSYLQTPLVNAEVYSTNTTDVVKTNTEGAYKITSEVGDVLVFKYPGMRNMEIVIEDVSRILNIEMGEEVNQLDEVVVEKTRIRSQKELRGEYQINKNLINTAFGILDKEITSFSVRIVDGSELIYGGIDFISALRYRVPGIRVDRPASNISVSNPNASNPVVYLRGGAQGFFPAIFDIDGLVTDQAPTYIQVENIERIAVLSGLGLVTKYGGKANGGVIVINTKGANFFPEPGTSDTYDQAKLRNNVFEGDAISSAAGRTNYMQALLASKSKEDAMATFQKNVSAYNNSFYNTLDAYDYFSGKWNDIDHAEAIVKERWYLFADNPVALKSLAYVYQARGEDVKANEVLKEVFVLRPHYAQSYMDLANSYRDLGNTKKAATIYARYAYLVDEGFLKKNDSDFSNLINREFNNLIALKGSSMISDRAILKNVEEEEFLGTRLVFEWSDSEAEFDLQFVNPEKHYYTWKHNILDNTERIKDEKVTGYSSEEYLIDNSLKGNWQVNVTYLGNKRVTPAYLKATIYYNYGTNSQRKETKVFKLSLRNVNQQLFTVRNGIAVATK